VSRPTRKSIFKDVARRMRSEFEDARNNVPHRGEAGGEGEQIVRRFLNDHLPGRYEATNGFIIDDKEEISGHIDVIIYDKLNCPVYRTSERGMIIPNDNVAAVVEVKFSLSSSSLDSAFEKIKEVKVLKKRVCGKSKGLEMSHTYGVIFAFECNLKCETIFDHWHRTINADNPISKACDMIVILDRGVLSKCINLPGKGVSSVDMESEPPAPVGTRYGLSCFECGEDSLDMMLGLLVPHLRVFSPQLRYPFFKFGELGPVPIRWVGVHTSEREIFYPAYPDGSWPQFRFNYSIDGRCPEGL
jgi:hypothetical protein